MKCRLKEPREILKMYFGEMSKSIIKERPDLLEMSQVRLTNIAKDLHGGFIASMRAKKEAPTVEQSDDFLKKAADIFLEHSEKRSTFKDKIRLSDDGKADPFVDAIMDYLSELKNDTRRIEACNNIIKVCRNISVKLQKAQ